MGVKRRKSIISEGYCVQALQLSIVQLRNRKNEKTTWNKSETFLDNYIGGIVLVLF